MFDVFYKSTLLSKTIDIKYSILGAGCRKGAKGFDISTPNTSISSPPTTQYFLGSGP